MIQIQNVTKSFNGFRALDDLSFTVPHGAVYGLVGPNGAGKSTLLRLLTGYLKPASGHCLLAGKPLSAWRPDALSRQRAVMRQNTQLGFDWPVEAVIGMGRAPWTRTPEAAVIQEIMRITECLPLAGRQFVALSGCFQPFRLESKWSCVLLCQMVPPVPETSVVCVVVIDQASPDTPERLDWYLRLDRSSGRRVFYPRFSLQFPSVYDNMALREYNRKYDSLWKDLLRKVK